MKKVICLFFCFMLINNSLPNITYSLDTAFLKKVQTEEQIAYAEIDEGKVKEGLHRLVQLFREAPLNDVDCLESLLGPFQLFCYTVSQHNRLLLSGFQSGISGSEERLLQPDIYPSDRLLMVGAYAMKKTKNVLSSGYLYQNIPKLINGEAKVPEVLGVGLGLLMFPEGQDVMGVPADYYRALSIGYMRGINEIEVKQIFVELHLLLRLEELAEVIKEKIGNSGNGVREQDAKTSLLSKLNEWGITEEEVITVSPGLNCISVGLPGLDVENMTADSFALWSEMITGMKDSQIRYILLSFLRFAPYFGEKT